MALATVILFSTKWIRDDSEFGEFTTTGNLHKEKYYINNTQHLLNQVKLINMTNGSSDGANGSGDSRQLRVVPLAIVVTFHSWLLWNYQQQEDSYFTKEIKATVCELDFQLGIYFLIKEKMQTESRNEAILFLKEAE